MMYLQRHLARPLTVYTSLRHLTSLPEIEQEKSSASKEHSPQNRENIYEFNKQSLIVYGPLLNKKTKSKRKFTPVFYKEPKLSENLDQLINVPIESSDVKTSLPILNLKCANDILRLNLNEILAQPLVPGTGTDESLWRTDEGEETDFPIRKKPSVTTILDKTMPEHNRQALERWKQEQIAELGEDGFYAMQKETLDSGHLLHASIQAVLSGQSESALDMTSEFRDGLWESVRAVLESVSDVRLLEANVSHGDLHYGGIVDCVAQYQNSLCVIDWKTSKKRKTSLRQTYDNPIQLAAYAGALNSTGLYTMKSGVLVYAYADGTPADVIPVPSPRMHRYWFLWLQRLQTYWKLQLEETKVV